MTGVLDWFSGLGSMFGTFALPLWVAIAAVIALFVALGGMLFGRLFRLGARRMLWRAAVVVFCAVVAWGVVAYSTARDNAAARRNLDARAADLAVRAIVPGSALACLDAVSNAAVEAACEKALFASPETIAAAMTYIDARLHWFADALAFAQRDPAFSATLERPRRALEADRYGIVAQVLATRGCNASQCPEFNLFRETRRLAANLKERTFDANVVLYASNWRGEEPALAAITPAPQASAGPEGASPAAAGTTAAGAPAVKYDFPSAASIPAVSIMNSEPAAPANGQEGAAARAQQQAPPRRQSSREPAPAPLPLPRAAPPAAAPAPAAPAPASAPR